jgi:hypothetical protein
MWLGIDEIKLKRFRSIFTNLHGRSLIDMLPESVCFDRHGIPGVSAGQGSNHARCHRHVGWIPSCCSRKPLPNAKIVVDKFHVLMKANMAFEAVRRKIARESSNGAGLGLKRAHKLFDKRAKDLNDEQYSDRLWLAKHIPSFGFCLRSQGTSVHDLRGHRRQRKPGASICTGKVRSPVNSSKPYRVVKTAFPQLEALTS